MNRLKNSMKWAKKSASRRFENGTAGFVYLIGCHDYVKVGVAVEIGRRLITLQTGCPYPLHLIKAFPVASMEESERLLHAHWKRYELRGEWFAVPDSELDAAIRAQFIEDIFKQ